MRQRDPEKNEKSHYLNVNSLESPFFTNGQRIHVQYQQDNNDKYVSIQPT